MIRRGLPNSFSLALYRPWYNFPSLVSDAKDIRVMVTAVQKGDFETA
jgi:hypothetical protein